jgi:hypothetical protein
MSHMKQTELFERRRDVLLVCPRCTVNFAGISCVFVMAWEGLLSRVVERLLGYLCHGLLPWLSSTQKELYARFSTNVVNPSDVGFIQDYVNGCTCEKRR